MRKNSSEETMKDNNPLVAQSLFLRRKRKEEPSLENDVSIFQDEYEEMKTRISTNESFKDGSELSKVFDYDKLVRRTYNDDKITNFFKSKKNLKGSSNICSAGGASGTSENQDKVNNKVEKADKNICPNSLLSSSASSNVKKVKFFESPSKISSSVKLIYNSKINSNNSPSKHIGLFDKQIIQGNINYSSPSSLLGSSKKRRLEKDIKDYFREFKLSSKTLLTLQKGKFLFSPGNKTDNLTKRKSSSAQTTPTKINKIVKNLPVQSPKTNDKNLKEVDRVINSLSMKERFEDLLKRELILPSTYKLLLLQFKTLDKIITHLKLEKKIQTSLDNINSFILSLKKGKSIAENLNLITYLPITQEDFGKMLAIAPYMYIYSNIKGKLVIDIPQDSERRIKVI